MQWPPPCPCPCRQYGTAVPLYLHLLAPHGTSTAGIPFESDKHYDEEVSLGAAPICSMPEGRRRTVRCRLPRHPPSARQLHRQREGLGLRQLRCRPVLRHQRLHHDGFFPPAPRPDRRLPPLHRPPPGAHGAPALAP